MTTDSTIGKTYQWPADKIIRRKVSDLTPFARNARTHTQAQIAQIAASIKEWGWTQPIIVDETGGILAGHGRLLAAIHLGLDEVPCVVASGWSEAKRRAYIIADNRLAELAGWDDGMLAAELQDLVALDFDLSLVGFDGEELDRLLHTEDEGSYEGLTDPDEIPEDEPEATISVKGDIWLLGKHRLMCGDSTSADDVARLMDGKLARLCFTSPPYGQQRDYQDDATAHVQDWDGLMQGVFGNLPMDEFGQVLVNLGLIHRDGEWVPYWDDWIEWMRSQGWRRFGWYVWDQGSGMPGDWGGRFGPSHEFVFHFNHQDASHPEHPAQAYWTGLYGQRHSNVFHFNKSAVKPKKTKEKLPESIMVNTGKGQRDKAGNVKERSNPEASLQTHKIPDSVIRVTRSSATPFAKEHPASYPVALPTEFISAWPGLIYEPFSGSGTTIIAGEQTLRPVYAMEISPGYVDLAIRRWQHFTGQRAIHAESGTPFHAS
jgi:DNA modification methylase